MDFSDAPQGFEKPEYSFVQRVSDSMKNSSERLASDLGITTAARFGGKMAEISNQGQISKMDLPCGWVERDKSDVTSNIGARSVREFTPPDAPDVKLSFFYRGLPCSETTGDAFKGILSKPPHHVTPTELKTLTEILRERGDNSAFSILAARTEDLNGKRVLIVEGRYRQTQQDLHEVIIDTDGTGRTVQEVFFQAPKDKFPRHLSEAKAALRSIAWKPQVEEVLNF